MSYKFAAEVGQTFGRWTVIDSTPIKDDTMGLKALCRCLCGSTKPVTYGSLRSGTSKSCGCLTVEAAKRAKTHGLTGHGLMSSYRHMVQRCSDVNSPSAHRYVGRGITICDRWKGSPENFIEDMLPKWFEGATLERKDNDGNYTPENCEWVSRKVQANNRSTCHYVTYNGQTKTITEWEEELGMNRGTLSTRLSRGMEVGEAMVKKVRHKNKLYEGFGRSATLTEWAEEAGIPFSVLYKRIFDGGLTLEKACLTPYNLRKSRK